MANHHLAVRWDDAGTLSSVIDLAHARELLPYGERAAVLELAPDRPVRYDAWDLESWTPTLGEPIASSSAIEVVDSGPLVGRLRVRYEFGASSATVTYTMRAGSARLDIGIELDWQHDEHLLSIVFPLDVRADTAACDIQFGHVRRPTHPSNSWDAAKFEVCAHRYVDLSEPDFGVAVLNDGRYGHGLFDGRVRVSLARAARYPDPDADRGATHRQPGAAPPRRRSERGGRRGRAIQPSAASRVRARQSAEAPAPIVNLTGDGVEIDAIKPADDGDGDLIVRLHESVGNRTRITVACDRRILAASRCNLLEEPQAGLEVGDGICALTVRPFELVTLRLTRYDQVPGDSADSRFVRYTRCPAPVVAVRLWLTLQAGRCTRSQVSGGAGSATV